MKVVEKIVKAACVEQDELEKKHKRNDKHLKYLRENGLAKTTLIHPVFTYYVVNINDKPVYKNEYKSLDPDVRCTNGCYRIRYLPSHSKKLRKNFHFCIQQDLVRYSVYVANYNHWLYLCKKVPEFDWLRRNSTLRESLFGLAVSHPGIPFIFTIDYDMYNKKIREQAKLENKEKELDDRPFVNYVCGLEEYHSKYENLKLVEETTKNSIIDKVKEADKEYESTSKND